MTPTDNPSGAGTPALPPAPPGSATLREQWIRFVAAWDAWRMMDATDLGAKSVRENWKRRKRELQRAMRDMLARSAAALQAATVVGAVPSAPAEAAPGAAPPAPRP